MKTSVRYASLFAAMLVVGCGISEPKELRVLGRIDQSASEPRVIVPDSVTVGESFNVRVLTAISGCQRVGDTESSVQGSSAMVTPFDVEFIQPPGAVCSLAVVDGEHEATLLFSAPGSAVVVVRARDLRTDVEIELEHPVVVR